MPELPEVETIRRGLERELPGRRIRRVRVHRPDILMGGTKPASFRRKVEGTAVRGVERRGKNLLLRLDPDAVLQVQLRMTGRFALGRAAPDGTLRHVAAEFDLDDGRTLYYDDVRRLGGFRLLRPEEWARSERELGPEPLSASFTAARLAALLAGRRAPVKNVLLDQRRVAGLGNIYVSEALFRARIDPRRPAGELAPPEVRRLHRSVRAVLREALERAGTTLTDYRSVDGRPGTFQERLRVYGREGEPCPRCGAPLRRIVQAGRSTFLCPLCQG